MTQTSTILAASQGAAWRLSRGEEVSIVNTHGSQVVDTWALAAEDPSEHSAMEHTRSKNSTIFLDEGLAVMSSKRRPMLTLVADTTPGRHDTLLCPCSAEIYAELGQPAGHRSCTGNFHEAIGALGLSLGFTPASLNLFMQVPLESDGRVRREPPASRPGDSVRLRAEMDLILVLSACPQDVTPINGAECRPRDVELLFHGVPA
ncbi:urea carboxylase-associated family protein [Paroceanicella profunda]|uniref:Urea carboxylase-associated family protein n=1 Tax=Paroceanicella profunda TaxID=2579971 RepID=A0A5B8G231_9RHOB|nr:urea carboxylase-associated family protein [Paroceanicella profunda]QDL92633.1 urea carboxylase-associated family protein [Paroceanicella profunda]